LGAVIVSPGNDPSREVSGSGLFTLRKRSIASYCQRKSLSYFVLGLEKNTRVVNKKESVKIGWVQNIGLIQDNNVLLYGALLLMEAEVLN
jgi:hypothetical protein